MKKLIRSLILSFVLLVLITPSISGKPNSKMELPAIVLEAGIDNGGISSFDLINRDSKIPLDWTEDLKGSRLGDAYPPENRRNITYGNFRSGEYRTAIFIFGRLMTNLGAGGGRAIEPSKIISGLLNTIEVCKSMDMKIIGINLIDSTSDLTWKEYDKNYTISVIDTLTPHMDLLILPRGNMFHDRFIDIAKENKIDAISVGSPEDYSFLSYGKAVLENLMMVFGLDD